jgi:hemoglobin
MAALWERAGGRAGIRVVLADFYDRVFDDVMIGHLFRDAEKARLIERECELTLAALGAPVVYGGRPIDVVHRPLPIMGGHFMRRRKLLADAIDRAGLPPEVRDAWLAHTDRLRPLVTPDRSGECDAPGAAARSARGGDPGTPPERRGS